MNWFWMGLYHAAAMLWETFWALVLGFGISAVLQVFVSREKMTQLLGRAGLREMLLATGFGAASSSCSYAAVAIGRTAFEMGAALTPALAFMFASTNLVVELGAVLWVLMGWRFVLAEVLGAFVLIGVMWLLMSIFFPRKLEQAARRHARTGISHGDDHCSHDHHDRHHDHSGHHGTNANRVANAFWMDWAMLWKEISIGFLIAGFLSTLVPHNWWQALFIQGGNAWIRLIENTAVGPLIAIVSFVCSVGNIPLANLLWAHGISFGGVISFIYADLLVIPIILIYRKYFGSQAAAFIVMLFYVSMVTAGIIVDLIFSGAGLIPSGPRTASAMEHATFSWNYTTWLDLVAIGAAASLLFLRLRPPTSTG